MSLACQTWMQVFDVDRILVNFSFHELSPMPKQYPLGASMCWPSARTLQNPMSRLLVSFLTMAVCSTAMLWAAFFPWVVAEQMPKRSMFSRSGKKWFCILFFVQACCRTTTQASNFMSKRRCLGCNEIKRVLLSEMNLWDCDTVKLLFLSCVFKSCLHWIWWCEAVTSTSNYR